MKSWEDLSTHFLNVIESDWYRTIMELEHQVSILTMQFYETKGLKTLHLPITTGSISSPMGLGSDSSPVKVNLCGIETYLADSMQFMLEYASRISEKGAYYVMPSFRGENADDRHLCQFYHSEAEIPGTLDDVIALVEDYIKYLCQGLLKNVADKIKPFAGDLDHIEKLASYKGGFPRVKFMDAVDKLKALNDNETYYEVREGGYTVITSKGEKKLIELYDGIVWLTHFEHISVPFYQAYDPEDPTKALNADLLFGIGETVGSGERHSTEAEVLAALKEHAVGREEYEWYCAMKEKYPLKTSGFGMGIERFLLWVLKHDDIRDCQILPRFNGVNIVP